MSRRMEQYTQCTLAQEWRQHCHALGATPAATKQWYKHLLLEYQRPGRHYHTLEHIVQMLNMARPLQHHFSAWCPAFFAIWFHDAVQGRGNNNELESAQLAQQALTQLGAPASVTKHTYQMILASETHDAPKDNDSALFIDCDLSILGSPTQAYQHYAQQCRKEYPVPDCLYRMGRRKFLNTLLARESIYQTPLAKYRLEKQARHNINMELATLGATR